MTAKLISINGGKGTEKTDKKVLFSLCLYCENDSIIQGDYTLAPDIDDADLAHLHALLSCHVKNLLQAYEQRVKINK